MRYTPCKIVEDGRTYTIPLYQRLFEWDTDNLLTLLEDLKKKYEETQGEDYYYIGMLTATASDELVDGQQRFTAMMLLGAVLHKYYEAWRQFLLPAEGKLRVDFSARPRDKEYLLALIEGGVEIGDSPKNLKMHSGYLAINQFMEGFGKEQQEGFAKYVYERLCFFVSYLPEGYTPKALNKYFERMNTTGKNLEQHEILKVRLLCRLGQDVDKYMALWNRLADVDTLLIRSKEGEGLDNALSANLASSMIDGLSDEENGDSIPISDVDPSSTKPDKERESQSDSQCALSFPYLLLHVLYRMIGAKIECSISDYFKPSNLLRIFEEYFPSGGEKDILEFMERLLKARLALDICFIRPTSEGYYLDMNASEDSEELKTLMMYQSMLYVSSSNTTHYKWFATLMDVVEEDGLPSVTKLYEALRDKSMAEHPLPSYEELSYGKDIRYWFWLLDFYIWLHRDKLFEHQPKEKKIAENYIFRRNRSLEHVAPQNPKRDSTMQWEKTSEDQQLRDSFGNLVMISAGLNSSLSNESYEVKRAHVEAYCNGSKTGSIESLKLLRLYMDYPNGWTKEAIQEHGEKMYEILSNELKA